jgi:hypothetical protein
MHCTILQPKGTTRNANIPAGETKLPAASVIGGILRRVGPPDLVGSWKKDGMIVHLFGYKTGKAGTENKHELPPPHDKVLLFGEAVVVATRSGDLVSFGTAEYTKFYNTAFGGFDDVGSEDSLSDMEDAEPDMDEEEEDAEDVESVASSESEELPIEEEEEEERPRPVPKLVKPKRTNKKIPAWFSVPELEPEAYTLVRS